MPNQNRPDPAHPNSDPATPIDPRAANEVLIDVTGGDAAAPNTAAGSDTPGDEATGDPASVREGADPDQYHLRDQDHDEARVDHERREQDRPATNAEELPEDEGDVEASRSTAERLQGHGSDPSPPAHVSDSGLRSSDEPTPVERTAPRPEPS